MQAELDDLVALAANEASSEVSHVTDSYGYLWIVVRDHDLDDLVTTVHLINSTLADRGFGPQLLASVFAFTGENDEPVHLVYLYKRGTFYPFAPLGSGNNRDNALELQVKGVLGDDLRIEQDLTRWFPVWGAPGL
jgi:hypothetical protein